MNKTMIKTVAVTLLAVAALSRTSQGQKYLLGRASV